jgi:hypothetical protein
VKGAAILLLGLAAAAPGASSVEREVKASHRSMGSPGSRPSCRWRGEVSARGGGTAIDASMAWSPGSSRAARLRCSTACTSHGGAELHPRGRAGHQGSRQRADRPRGPRSRLATPLRSTSRSATETSRSAISPAVALYAPDSAVKLERTGPIDVEAREVTAEIGSGGSITTPGRRGGDRCARLPTSTSSVTTESGPVTSTCRPTAAGTSSCRPAARAPRRSNLGGLSARHRRRAVRFDSLRRGRPAHPRRVAGGTITVDDLR